MFKDMQKVLGMNVPSQYSQFSWRGAGDSCCAATLIFFVFHYRYQSYKYERITAGKSAGETVTAVVRRHLHLEGKRIPSNPSAFLLRAGAT